jgi:hypothetical protein
MVMAKVVMHIVLFAAVMIAMAMRTEGEKGITFANCELTMTPCVAYFVSLDLTDECCWIVEAPCVPYFVSFVSLDLTGDVVGLLMRLCMQCRKTFVVGTYVIAFSVHMGRPTPAKLLLLWQCVAKSIKEESARYRSVNAGVYIQGLLPFRLFKHSFISVIFLYFFQDFDFSISQCGRTG